MKSDEAASQRHLPLTCNLRYLAYRYFHRKSALVVHGFEPLGLIHGSMPSAAACEFAHLDSNYIESVCMGYLVENDQAVFDCHKQHMLRVLIFICEFLLE